MFDFDAGAVCLDFCNTVEWHDSEEPVDHLQEYADLVRWGEAAELLSAEEAGKLRQRGDKDPAWASLVFQNAVALREAIYRIFVRFSQQEEVAQQDLDILNGAVRHTYSHLRLRPSNQGFEWQFEEVPATVDQVIWQVVRSAGELLSGDQLDRVSQCADDRGCGYLFLDTSRNRSRLWCSMESCGNRAKARRHYRRRKRQKKQRSSA